MEIAVGLALLSAFGFASGSILMRIATQYISPPTATFFTVLVGAVMVSAIAFARNFDEIKALPLVAYGWIAVMGVLAYPLARVLHNSAISMVGAARAVPMISLQPLLAFAFGVLLLGERPGLFVTVGTPVIVAGLLMVAMPRRPGQSAQDQSTQDQSAQPQAAQQEAAQDQSTGPQATGPQATHQEAGVRRLGYLLAIGASTAFASRDAISRHVVGVLELAPPFVMSGFSLVIGGAVLFAFTSRGVVSTIRDLPPRYVAICCLAGLLQGMAVASLFQAVSRAPVTIVTPIYASQPVFTLVLAWLFLRRLERLNLLLATGTLLSVAGVVLVILGATG